MSSFHYICRRFYISKKLLHTFFLLLFKITESLQCILNVEVIAGTFYDKELQKTNQTEFKIKKSIKKKGDKLYVKWQSYENSFNKWVDKNDVIV